MKTSTSIINLSKALLTAQKQMGAAVKGAKNPFFKSNYADLPTVMEVVKEPLNDAGIIILQPTSFNEHTQKNYITTTLIHADSGEWIQGDTEIKMGDKQGPQDFGAAQTYARRFGLQSMLFIPAEDDDGNSVSGRTVQKTVYAPPGKIGQQTTVPTVAAGTTVVPPLVATAETTLPLGAVQMEPLKRTSSFSKKGKPPVTTPVATLAPEQQADFE